MRGFHPLKEGVMNLYRRLLGKEPQICFKCGKEKKWLYVVFVFNNIAGACDACCRKYPDADALEIAINKGGEVWQEHARIAGRGSTV